MTTLGLFLIIGIPVIVVGSVLAGPGWTTRWRVHRMVAAAERTNGAPRVRSGWAKAALAAGLGWGLAAVVGLLTAPTIGVWLGGAVVMAGIHGVVKATRPVTASDPAFDLELRRLLDAA